MEKGILQVQPEKTRQTMGRERNEKLSKNIRSKHTLSPTYTTQKPYTDHGIPRQGWLAVSPIKGRPIVGKTIAGSLRTMRPHHATTFSTMQVRAPKMMMALAGLTRRHYY